MLWVLLIPQLRGSRLLGLEVIMGPYDMGPKRAFGGGERGLNPEACATHQHTKSAVLQHLHFQVIPGLEEQRLTAQTRTLSGG